VHWNKNHNQVNKLLYYQNQNKTNQNVLWQGSRGIHLDSASLYRLLEEAVSTAAAAEQKQDQPKAIISAFAASAAASAAEESAAVAVA